MTKIRQFVSLGMAVIMMCSTVNPHSVYADELPSESEIEQSETEQPTEIESVTETESELESETASETDTELENDGIYNDAEYIDDLMINDIAVYANSRPTGDGREPSGGSLSGGGHRPTRSSGGHSVSGNTTASQTINNIVVNFSTDLRNDIEDIANILYYVQNKLVSINNNLCDAIGYLYDISMAVERVSSSVSTCANWLAKSKDVLDNILSNILKGNVLIASINVDVGNINKSLTSYLTSFDSLISNGFKDVSGTWISNRVYYIFQDLSVIKTTVSSINKFLGETLSSALLYNGGGLSFMYIFETVINSINAHLAVIRLSVDDVESKLNEIISAVKDFSPSIVINNFIDNSDRTKSDDEDENASLFDLIKMIMYSVFILGSLLDLLLLLLEYVVLMFQIPAVPALMNENVLLGWNYANAICIPGTQFSIVSFLRLLMYITVIFSAINVIKKAIDNGSIGVI